MANTQTETKRTPVISATVLRNPNGHARGLLLEFSNGKTLTVDREHLTPEMEAEACMHGLKQKFVDAAAIARNPETGRSATVSDKFDAVAEVVHRVVYKGEWNATREGGGSGSLLYKALCRIHADKTPEAIREWLAVKTDEQKAALRKNPKVASAILEIQAEQAKDSGIDSDALLNELA